MQPGFFRFLVLIPVLLLGGCAGYEVLEPAAEPVHLAVLPVLNDSELPQIIAPLARNLREKVAHSPNWKLVNAEDADAALQVTVRNFTRSALARDPGDTGRPLSYLEEVEVTVEWISELPPPWGPQATVNVRTDQLLYSQPSLTNAESVAMAEIADRLAEKILQQLDWTGSSL